LADDIAHHFTRNNHLRASAMVQRSMAQATRLLTKPPHWRAVEALANELLLRRALDGQQAQAIIRAAIEGGESRGTPACQMVA
jgi:hypothetical protein